MPLPLIVPPVQVSAPVTVTVSLPVNVPLNVNEGVVIKAPVEKFSVPLRYVQSTHIGYRCTGIEIRCPPGYRSRARIGTL